MNIQNLNRKETSMRKHSFGRRINDWLDEPDGEQFTDGKWRFWLPAVLGFSILNAVLTVMIFRETASANYLTPALLAASAIVSWIAIGCLHYSDAKRGRMARGVSALDSASLLFVIGHFCFLVYILGHAWILRSAEAKYAQDIATYNAQAEKISADNKQIIEAAARIAETEKQTERLRNDTAYWSRKNGVKVQPSGVKVEVSTSKVEMPPPPKAPEDSQAAFLTRWDALVRITNFGELILAAITLIFIRNWTAKSNTQTRRDDEDFPDEIEADITRDDRTGRRLDRTRKSDRLRQSYISEREAFDRKKARKKLLEHLKVISHYLPGRWFKADLIEGGVHIRMCARVNFTEQTIADTRQSDKLLAAVDRPDFRERLLDELIHRGFPIEKEKMSL
jgi:hypothetical protein